MWKFGLRSRSSFSGNTLIGISLQCGGDVVVCDGVSGSVRVFALEVEKNWMI